jgi:uncharacterized membrane protein YhiD involved in acid resistance
MDLTPPAPLSVPLLVVNLALGIVLSLVVAWYYVRFGQSLSNRSQFAPLLPMLTLITVLVISVVKSSLALSLGLVGALSIVRFRTAIKDPEELVFLFFAIGIGLALGADQRIPAVIAVAVIVAYLLVRARLGLGRGATHSLYLNIEVNDAGADSPLFAEINQMLLREVPEIDLRRLDSHDGRLQVTYYVSISDQDTIVSIMDNLKKRLPDSSLSLVEQNNLLGG